MKKNKSTISIKILKNQKWLTILVISITANLTIPTIITYQYSCLNNNSNQSYLYSQCNTNQILNSFTILILITIFTAGIATFLFQPSRSKLYPIINTIIVGTIGVIVFYSQLTGIITKVESTPIILSEDFFGQ
jgi:hypothetical protein